MKRHVSTGKLIGASLLLAMTLLFPLQGRAQTSREHIRNAISEYGECKSVAITRTGGDLMLYGRNGYASKGCPDELTAKLKELNRENKTIVDVVLTEKENWLIIWGSNGFAWSGIPYELKEKLREYNDENYTVTSVAFNDDEDWVVVSEEKFAASSTTILDWLKEGKDKYGALWTVYMTDDAMVAVYDRGVRYVGEVPSGMKEAIREATFDVYRAKFTNTAWFIANKSGKSYRYHM